ncbi:MAG: hypothetical protein II275_07850 [Bacteroidaceae bacterium]|nr:hypothetical protein [Bacteroidaceae bacterium]
MTDEEMAKEYAVKNWEHYEEGQSDYDALKQAFLAGLKAGRPKWHKVADGDLPKEDDVYLLYTTKGFLLGHYEQGGSDRKVDFCGESYSDFTEYPSEEEFMETEVIAWCEIPQYTEE